MPLGASMTYQEFSVDYLLKGETPATKAMTALFANPGALPADLLDVVNNGNLNVPSPPHKAIIDGYLGTEAVHFWIYPGAELENMRSKLKLAVTNNVPVKFQSRLEDIPAMHVVTATIGDSATPSFYVVIFCDPLSQARFSVTF